MNRRRSKSRDRKRRKRPPVAYVPPPVPAPYLEGVEQLPDELLLGDRHEYTPAEERRANRAIARIRERLYIERRNYEAREKVRIVPEPRPGI